MPWVRLRAQLVAIRTHWEEDAADVVFFPFEMRWCQTKNPELPVRIPYSAAEAKTQTPLGSDAITENEGRIPSTQKLETARRLSEETKRLTAIPLLIVVVGGRLSLLGIRSRRLRHTVAKNKAVRGSLDNHLPS